ncbi:hypothetical protein MVEG_00148 [Podila verticillata NRRL 6337]|nr:hypothetical protein MVEG_00148 [Podila verticillata NRRL 6337]
MTDTLVTKNTLFSNNTRVANNTVTVNCATPHAIGDIFSAKVFVKPFCNSFWACTLTNRAPQLEIMLVWNCAIGYYVQPLGLQSFRVVKRDGTIVSSVPVPTVDHLTTLNAIVDMAPVQVKGRLDFDIVLTTSPSINVPSKLKVAHVEAPRSKSITYSLMKDIATTNMAFTFGFNGSARNVALWVHQSVLLHQPYLASFLGKLQDVEGSGDSSASGVKCTHVTEYSLEGYCSLIRFLYTGTIDLEVNLEDFAIGCPPKKPYSASCKKRPIVEGLFSPAVNTSSATETDDFKRHTSWSEMFQLADCYKVSELREYCKSKIVASITQENGPEMLFRFAYKYQDMKDVLLQHVADILDKMFATDKDPFEAYKDHPEKHDLLIKILQRKYKTAA